MSNQIEVVCLHCSKKVAVPAEMAGRKARCGCGEIVRIPSNTDYVEVSVEEAMKAAAYREPPEQVLTVGAFALLMIVVGTSLFLSHGVVDTDSDFGLVIWSAGVIMVFAAPILGVVGMMRRRGRALAVIAILISLCVLILNW